MPTADRICPNRKTFSLLPRHVSNVTLTESNAYEREQWIAIISVKLNTEKHVV